MNDLPAAWRLPADEAARLADPLLAELRELSEPSHPDPAGIPYRGSEVFRELLEGRFIAELRAAYVTLRRLDCQSGVMDALESTHGAADV